ncbi:MAG TPA: hypothetical protein VHW26_09025 [Solirubrobacteraceae bacterium]|nr:hypothetical protein [Solirubrobacteraceae bacterium]
MTDKTTRELPIRALPAAAQTAADGTSPTVSAFVAAAITEHRRADGLAQLLADMVAIDDEPTDDDRGSARDTLGVS